MNPTTLTEMRQAAQSANELASKVTELPHKTFPIYFFGGDEKLHISNQYISLGYAAKTTVPKLADAVTQLCDEVERLREALTTTLKHLKSSNEPQSTPAVYRPPAMQMRMAADAIEAKDTDIYNAQLVLKQSKERFGE